MRKTTHTLEFTVEGPNNDGRYLVTGPDYETSWLKPEEFYNKAHKGVVRKHIDSAPKVEVFEGYQIALRPVQETYGAWGIGEDILSYLPLVDAKDSEEAYAKVAQYATNPYQRGYITPLLVLARYLEQKEKHND